MTQVNNILKADLDSQLVELARERKISKQLESKLDGEAKSRVEMIGWLSKTRYDIMDKLGQGGELLGSIFSLQQSTQTKYKTR